MFISEILKLIYSETIPLKIVLSLGMVIMTCFKYLVFLIPVLPVLFSHICGKNIDHLSPGAVRQAFGFVVFSDDCILNRFILQDSLDQLQPVTYCNKQQPYPSQEPLR